MKLPMLSMLAGPEILISLLILVLMAAGAVGAVLLALTLARRSSAVPALRRAVAGECAPGSLPALRDGGGPGDGNGGRGRARPEGQPEQ